MTALQAHKQPDTTSDAASRIKASAIFRQQAWLNGEWTDSAIQDCLTVTNPGNSQTLGTVPNMGATETERAISAAVNVYPEWAGRTARERARYLRHWADLMLANREDLATLMTLEQGKPINEARGEIDYAASFLEWFGEEAKRAYGDTIPTHKPGHDLIVRREPVGVSAAITPWNFPSAMITRKAGAALAAGCPMICRPASETPYSALALAELARQAGIPGGVFQVITGDGRAIGSALTESRDVRKISFTGSTEIGRQLLAQSAESVKKISLELGGHAPFIVFPEADFERAVDGALGAKFATTGQDCLAVNRLYVHRDIYEAFAQRLTEKTQAMRLAYGLDETADLGPLMNEAAVEKCEAHVRDALNKGARLLTGGTRASELGPLFYEPTVLADITPDMRIAEEETFGPVAGIMAFDTEDEVIARANDTIYGLASYIYSRDVGRCHRVSNALEYGMVGVNAPSFTGAEIPFGGVKQSGIGREGSKYGLDDYTELKYICHGDIDV